MLLHCYTVIWNLFDYGTLVLLDFFLCMPICVMGLLDCINFLFRFVENLLKHIVVLYRLQNLKARDVPFKNGHGHNLPLESTSVESRRADVEDVAYLRGGLSLEEKNEVLVVIRNSLNIFSSLLDAENPTEVVKVHSINSKVLSIFNIQWQCFL